VGIDKWWQAGLSVFVKIRRGANPTAVRRRRAGDNNFGGMGSVSIGAWGWASPTQQRVKQTTQRIQAGGVWNVALRGPRCRGNLVISHWKVSNA
jgi:hypothetical protein